MFPFLGKFWGICSLVFYATTILGQVVCPPSSPSMGEDCNSTCITCDATVFGGTVLGALPGATGTCHEGTADVWFGFIAGADLADFDVIWSGCVQGPGALEWAIYADCDGPAIACASVSSFNGFPIKNIALVPGRPYYFVVNNALGPLNCSFTVVSTPSHAMRAPNIGPIPTIEGPDKVCPGVPNHYALRSPVFGAVRYVWDGPPGTLVNGQPVPVTLSYQDGTAVTATFQNGGELKVTCSNMCRAPASKTKPVSIVTAPTTRLKDAESCFAYTLPWGEIATSTGLYERAFRSFKGCDSIVQQFVQIVGPAHVTLPVQSICEGDSLVFCKQVFKKPGQYSVTCPSFRGCDSTTYFTIQYGSYAQINGGGALECFANGIVPLRASPTAGTKVWRNPLGQVVSGADTIRVGNTGWYHLTVNAPLGIKTCRLRDSVFIAAKGPLDISATGGNLTCAAPNLALRATSNLSGVQYQWVHNGQTLSNTAQSNAIRAGSYRVTGQVGQCRDTAIVAVTQDSQLPTVNPSVSGVLTCKTPNVTLTATSSATNPVFAWTGPNGFASNQAAPKANTAGTYTVVVRNQGGNCSQTATLVVLEDKTVPIVATTGGTLPCPPLTLTLQCQSNLPNATFAWAGPGTFTSTLRNPSVSVAGLYNVVVTNPVNGCTAAAKATVSGGATTIVALATGGELSPAQPTLELFCYTDATSPIYDWKGPANFKSSLSNPVVRYPGLYTVRVTEQSTGCQAVATAEVVYALPKNNGSLGRKIFDNGWELFPNPAHASVQVRHKDEGEALEVQVVFFDATGRRVLEQSLCQPNAWIDVHTLPAGVYQVAIQSQKTQVVKRLVVGTGG